jgi:ubiquitin C-terminal hydrolase
LAFEKVAIGRSAMGSQDCAIPIGGLPDGLTFPLSLSCFSTPVLVKVQPVNAPFVLINIDSAPAKPVSCYLTFTIQNNDPSLSLVYRKAMTIDSSTHEIQWHIPLLKASDITDDENGWNFRGFLKFNLQFAEAADRICDILSDVSDDEIVIPFSNLTHADPAIFHITLPLLLQYQPEHFASIRYADTNWVVHLESRDGRPDNPIVLIFTTIEAPDTPIKFKVNLSFPDAGVSPTAYTVRPGEKDFEIELPVHASALLAHGELEFSVALEEDQGIGPSYSRIGRSSESDEGDEMELVNNSDDLFGGSLLDDSDDTNDQPPHINQPPAARTGYVGLKNQGATCYMNSMLQALFCTPAFRRLVYEMPTTGAEDPATSIPLCLQRLFCRMQVSGVACSTEALTKSFGWDGFETIVQHDVQEFSRVLIDNLERKTKGTVLEGRVAALFRGKFRSFVRCPRVGFESSRDEEFYDLSLVVKGVPNLMASFQKYVEVEELTGDNQYDCGELGKQDAAMGTEFLEFPPILHLHLGRFEYDHDWRRLIKINDRFEFPTTIDLSRFLADQNQPAIYDLHGVLVHAGGASAGHYYAFLRPSIDVKWLKFNDTIVSRVGEIEAVECNFGAPQAACPPSTAAFYPRNMGFNASGYMLIYVRQSDADAIFRPIDDSFIPQHLRDYATRDEASATSTGSIEITVSSEASLSHNCLCGRVGFECPALHRSAVFSRSADTYATVYRRFSELFNIPVGEMELWTAWNKFAPYSRLVNNGTPLTNLFDRTCFLRRVPAGAETKVTDTVLFLKFFNPALAAPLQYVGSMAVNWMSPVDSLFPRLSALLGFPDDTEYRVWEEVSSVASSLRRIRAAADRPAFSGTAQTLIFETESGQLPPTTHNWDEPINITAETVAVEQVGQGLPFYSFREPPRTVEQFLAGNVDAVMARFEEPAIPVARICFSKTISVQALTDLLCTACGVELDRGTDSALIYPVDPTDPGIPARTFIDPDIPGEVAYEFSQKIEHRVFLRIISGLTLPEVRLRNDIQVDYSADAVHVQRSIRIFTTPGEVIADIRARLVDSDFIPDVPNLRFWTVSGHAVQRLFMNFTRDTLHNAARLRIDLVPSSQESLLPGRRLVEVDFRINDIYLVPTGNPFYFVIALDESGDDLRARLHDCLTIDEVQWKSTAVLIAHTPNPATLRTGAIVKGHQSLREIIALNRIDFSDLYLFVVEQSKKAGRGCDRSVKLYN